MKSPYEQLDAYCATLVRRINLHGISFSAVSRLSGVSRPTIRKMMDGKTLHLDTLKKIAIGLEKWREINKHARMGIL